MPTATTGTFKSDFYSMLLLPILMKSTQTPVETENIHLTNTNCFLCAKYCKIHVHRYTQIKTLIDQTKHMPHEDKQTYLLIDLTNIY